MTPEVEYNFNLMRKLDSTSTEEIKTKSVELSSRSKHSSNKTLILDMDETLIHSVKSYLDYSKLNVTVDEARTLTYRDNDFTFKNFKVFIRPHAIRLLKELSELYEIIVFTSAEQCYADSVLNFIDPENKYISQRFYRETCVLKNGKYIKDLRVFSNRKMNNIVILDNSITCFSNQLRNGVFVPSFYGQQDDNCLETVIDLLKGIAEVDNIPCELESILGLEKLYKEYLDNIVD